MESNKRCSVSRYFQDRTLDQNKKSRTRGVLFDSALAMFCQDGISNVRLEDIMQYAGMATGTFYNHFKDKDELIHALAISIVLELLGSYEEDSLEIKDSPIRIVVLIHIMMSAALQQNSWGEFLAQAFYLVPPSYLNIGTCLKEDIDSGAEQGVFTITPDLFQLDQVSSLLLSGMRRLGEDDENIIERTSENILRLLGVSPTNARLAIGKAQAFL
jgi:AcrR family transcriptional regulator